MFLLPQDYWEVKDTPKKGRGVFAKKDIPAGTVIGDYLGILTLDTNYDERASGLYDMCFNDTMSIVADKNKIGIHLINHSCSPNCDMFPYQGHEIYFACRRIFSGEELTVHYFLDPPEKNHICNHVCYCESLICHGTWHVSPDYSKRFEEFIILHNGKYIEHPPVPVGKELPLLKSYPKNVSDYSIYDLYGCLTQKPLEMNTHIFPSMIEIRKMIRDKGRMIYLKNIQFYIFGITNGLIIGTEKLSSLI